MRFLLVSTITSATAAAKGEAGAMVHGVAQVADGEVDSPMNAWLEVLGEGGRGEAERGGENS